MPVVIGQPIEARCFLATAARISLIVISLPFGTRRMMASTSIGAGMAIVPVPQRVVILPMILPTFGRSLLSLSFSRQDLRLAIAVRSDEFAMKPGARCAVKLLSISTRSIIGNDVSHDWPGGASTSHFAKSGTAKCRYKPRPGKSAGHLIRLGLDRITFDDAPTVLMHKVERRSQQLDGYT